MIVGNFRNTLLLGYNKNTDEYIWLTSKSKYINPNVLSLNAYSSIKIFTNVLSSSKIYTLWSNVQ